MHLRIDILQQPCQHLISRCRQDAIVKLDRVAGVAVEVARTRGREVALTIAPQGPATKGATIAIPRALRGAALVNQMTGEKLVLSGASMKVSDLLGGFPAGLLVGTLP